ncbi:MAG: YdeI/OmpD-associated family protein [Pseudomonadota bacterium]
MTNKDPRIDAYIAKSAAFAQPILTHLRALIHAHCPDAVETIKWSVPHFEYQGRILCGCAAFKQHCSFGFWLGDLLPIDTKPDAAMGQFGRITSLADLPSDKDFAKLVKQAMKLQDAGAKAPSRVKPAAEKKELEVPPAFLAAVKKNKLALATFEAFTPSKKKEYVEWYSEAKTEATREKRLAQAIEWMAEGKSRNWKYQNC